MNDTAGFVLYHEIMVQCVPIIMMGMVSMVMGTVSEFMTCGMPIQNPSHLKSYVRAAHLLSILNTPILNVSCNPDLECLSVSTEDNPAPYITKDDDTNHCGAIKATLFLQTLSSSMLENIPVSQSLPALLPPLSYDSFLDTIKDLPLEPATSYKSFWSPALCLLTFSSTPSLTSLRDPHMSSSFNIFNTPLSSSLVTTPALSGLLTAPCATVNHPTIKGQSWS
jgi:hypothetical protein